MSVGKTTWRAESQLDVNKKGRGVALFFDTLLEGIESLNVTLKAEIEK